MFLNKNKKGAFELGVNFIVITILCLALLGIGFFLLAKGSNAFEKEYAKIKSMQESQVRSAMAREGKLAMVYPNTITLNRGDAQIFSLGVTNQLGRQENFWVYLIEAPGQTSEAKILMNDETAIALKNAETGFIPIRIETSKKTGKVSYIFNVCVYAQEIQPSIITCPDPSSTYGDMQKIIINVN